MSHPFFLFLHNLPYLDPSLMTFLSPRLQINLGVVHLSEAINYGDEKEKYQSQTATSLATKLLIK